MLDAALGAVAPVGNETGFSLPLPMSITEGMADDRLKKHLKEFWTAVKVLGK